MNHLTEEQLVLYHYGDTDGAGAGSIEEHLHACASCQAELDSIRRTLETVDALQTPAREEEYGAAVWARLQPSLAATRGSWWERVNSFFVPRRLALAGAVAALVVAAFVAGRVMPGKPGAEAVPPGSVVSNRPASGPAPATVAPGVQATATPATTENPMPTTDAAREPAAADRERVRDRILLVAVGDHLERSQMALIELVNSPAGATVDISGEQERARDLVTENRLYRQAALTTGDPAVASVLDDLERVLVEIANSPSTMTESEFESVRKRIEQQGIIFKVRVFGSSVRERELRSAAGAGIRG